MSSTDYEVRVCLFGTSECGNCLKCVSTQHADGESCYYMYTCIMYLSCMSRNFVHYFISTVCQHYLLQFNR